MRISRESKEQREPTKLGIMVLCERLEDNNVHLYLFVSSYCWRRKGRKKAVLKTENFFVSLRRWSCSPSLSLRPSLAMSCKIFRQTSAFSDGRLLQCIGGSRHQNVSVHQSDDKLQQTSRVKKNTRLQNCFLSPIFATHVLLPLPCLQTPPPTFSYVPSPHLLVRLIKSSNNVFFTTVWICISSQQYLFHSSSLW